MATNSGAASAVRLSLLEKDLFFENARLSIDDTLCVTFCWAANLAVKSTAIMACVCPTSVSQWYQFLREKCSEALLKDNDYTFGGPGVVVQIDESVVAKRKYHVRNHIPAEVKSLTDVASSATKVLAQLAMKTPVTSADDVDADWEL